MTKQEKLLEDFAIDKFNRIKSETITWETTTEIMRWCLRQTAQEDFEYLRSQGLVIQTGDIPEEYWTREGNNIVINRIPAAIRQFLIEYKYKQVEPLI